MQNKKIKELSIACLVTARGKNSFKRKHLQLILGKPLIEYPFMVSRLCSSLTDFYVSSDDNEILDIGEKYGFKTIKRPLELSIPTAQHIDAIEHALLQMAKDNIYPDILVVILGNTVYFKPEWIEKSIQIIADNQKLSAVVPVYEDQDHHPYRAKRINENGMLVSYFPKLKNISTNRQDLKPNYFLCHNFWTLNVKKSIQNSDKGQQPWTFLGNKIYPLILEENLDVHDEKDILQCEQWLMKNS